MQTMDKILSKDRADKEIDTIAPLLHSTAGNIFGMWIANDKFAKIDPKDTVDKLNKSKLTGNANVNKMVLPLVSSCWW